MNELNQKLAAIDTAHRAAANFEKSVALLSAIKAGTVTLDQVELVADGWRLVDVVAANPNQTPCLVVVEEEHS